MVCRFMSPGWFCCLVVLCLTLILPSTSRAEIQWHWEDQFSAQEKRKLQDWVERTVGAVSSLVSPYPFDIHIHFYKMAGRGEPVPWANTRRGRRQGVNFYVDPSFPLQAFLEDWTAPHELSHLLIPSVGDQYSWFAEGFASYMQYQIMAEMGVLSRVQVLSRYQRNITRAHDNYGLHHLSFDQAGGELRRQRAYPTLYWGGAVYFLQVEARLQQRNQSLISLLADYMRCCRLASKRLSGLVTELNDLSDSDIFSSQLRMMKVQKGFPSYSGLLPPP